MLLVEDDPILRNTLARLLRSVGHEVLTAKDAGEALELLANDLLLPPWVIVTDLVMPGQGGDKLIEAVQRSARFANIAVVVITGLPPHLRPEMSADVMLTKPVSHTQLDAVLKTLMMRNSLRLAAP